MTTRFGRDLRAEGPTRWFGVVAAGLALLISTAATTTAQTDADAIIRVNQRTVTQADLQQRLELRLMTLENANLPPETLAEQRGIARDETVRDLYEEALLLARADEIGIQIDAAEVDRQVVQVVGTPEFQRAIERETEGDRDRVVARIHADILKKLTVQEVFRREVQPRVRLSEGDLKTFYAANPQNFATPGRVLARAAVVQSSPDRSEEDLQRIAGEIQASVNAGRSLDEAAGPYVDVGIAREPVDLDWILRGQVEPEIEESMWSTKIGGATAPFPAEGGLHVLQIVQREEGGTLPFESIKGRLESELRFARFSEQLAEYLYELETHYQVGAAEGEIPERVAVSPSVATPDPPMEVAATPAEPMTVQASPPDARGDLVESAVRSWAAAWSAQDVEAYLAAYSAGFRPANGASRAAWSDQRRDRVSKPEFIRVELSNLRTETDGDRATARFGQAYSSGNYSDQVEKTLELVWEDGSWKIVSEVSR